MASLGWRIPLSAQRACPPLATDLFFTLSPSCPLLNGFLQVQEDVGPVFCWNAGKQVANCWSQTHLPKPDSTAIFRASCSPLPQALAPSAGRMEWGWLPCPAGLGKSAPSQWSSCPGCGLVCGTCGFNPGVRSSLVSLAFPQKPGSKNKLSSIIPIFLFQPWQLRKKWGSQCYAVPTYWGTFLHSGRKI